MRRDAFLALGFVVAMVGSASGQEPPCVFPRADQVNAHVKARVTQSGTDFDYRYMLENRIPASQRLVKFAVQAFVASGTPIIQTSAADWRVSGRIADSDFYVWDTFGKPRGLTAGASAVGFGFSHASLPAIVMFSASGAVQPPTFREGEAPSSCEGDDVIENSFKGATVGPKPLSQPFVPIEFLNYLITLLHDSRQLGWVRSDKEQKELLKILLKAKRRLEGNEPAKAAKRIDKFLKEVKEESCQDFHCRKEKALTSEAYALLFFNGQFLLQHLPPPSRERDDDDD